jgi:hypothetical protein
MTDPGAWFPIEEDFSACRGEQSRDLVSPTATEPHEFQDFQQKGPGHRVESLRNVNL